MSFHPRYRPLNNPPLLSEWLSVPGDINEIRE